MEAQLSALMQSILASRVSKFQTAAQKTELKSSLAGLVNSKLYLWNFFLIEDKAAHMGFVHFEKIKRETNTKTSKQCTNNILFNYLVMWN